MIKNRNKLHLSLSEEFAIISFLILFIGMLIVGWWLDREIKQTVFQQIVQTTRLFVDSFYSKLVKELANQDHLNSDTLVILDSLDHNSLIGKQIAFMNIWSRNGKLAYSSDPDIIGGEIPFTEKSINSGKDQVRWKLYQPEELKPHLGINFDDELLEVFLPIHRARSDEIIAVAELYLVTRDLRNAIFKAQIYSLALLTLVSLITFILLYSIVRKGNKVIWKQQNELENQINQLSDLLVKNQQLHLKAQSATFKTSEVSEKLLRRISAELHDAPAQYLGYALLRLDSIASKIRECSSQDNVKEQIIEELKAIQNATSEALQDIRSLSTSLSMPSLENLCLQQVVQRVVNIHQRRTNTQVAIDFTQIADKKLPMALMICIYRFVQEALNNAYQHGKGIDQQVKLKLKEGKVIIEVSDRGPGFDIQKIDFTGDHLGLIGIRERVESLGGSFKLRSVIGQGTILTLTIPCNGQRTANA